MSTHQTARDGGNVIMMYGTSMTMGNIPNSPYRVPDINPALWPSMATGDKYIRV